MEYRASKTKNVSENYNKDRISKREIITRKSLNDIQTDEDYIYSELNHNSTIKISGFPNIGFSCYMNSFLQILFHTPFFLSLLKQNYKEKEKKNLIDCLISLSESPNNIYILYKIKDLMGEIDDNFRKNIQKDSQYFGIMLINEIISLFKNDFSINDDYNDSNDNNDESNEKISIFEIEKKKTKLFKDYINKYHNEKDETFVEKMFQFHESKVKIDKNQLTNDLKVKRIDFETFLSADLIFPFDNQKRKYNIYDLLKNRYSPLSLLRQEPRKNNKSKIELFWDSAKNYLKEFVNDNNSNDNIDNSEKNPIRKNFIIRRFYSLPNILILTLNRMIFGKPFNNSKFKIDEKIDLKDFLDENNNEEITTYSLYGLNECYKFKEKYGHYYSYVKINNIWYFFDDKRVLEKDPEFESKDVVGLYYIRDTFQRINNNQ